MRNKTMAEWLATGEAIDVSSAPRTRDGDYILSEVRDGLDYCDAKEEMWIWSIGKHRETGQILASVTVKFYQNPEYQCLWLR